VSGGLYHVITLGNNRRQIFNSPAGYEKFLSLLAVQKSKLSFFLEKERKGQACDFAIRTRT
jgi:hypothetical protein